jgi:short-subunit dehydrogenase
VSNAGYGYFGAIEEIEPEQAKANFETNVFGTLWLMQATLPILRAQASGHIITVSSIGGVIGFPTGGTYTATKFAVEAISEGLASEVAAFGIKVTILEPGHFTTASAHRPGLHRRSTSTTRYARPFAPRSSRKTSAIRKQQVRHCFRSWTQISHRSAWRSARERS